MQAIDGSTTTSFDSIAVQKAWWMVDLGDKVDIENIRILPRQDCCIDRFPNLE
ncbi:hypothetical protein SK128_010058, partial [Halocaridina rubra]